MKKNNNWIYVIISLLCAAVIIFLCLFLSYMNTSEKYKTTLENNYRKSFYEVVDNINNMEIDLSKLVATNDRMSQKVLLSSLYNTSSVSVANINNLPISYNKLSNINNLLNKTNGFAYSLLDKIYIGQNVSDEDYEQISNLHTSLLEIKYDLNKYLSNWKYDYRIIDDVDFDDSSFNGGLIDTESSNAEIPSLIYDGPFSESVLNKEIVGLKNFECGISDAKDYLVSIFGNDVSYVSETNGKFETYNFLVNNNTYASVTKKGKLLLSLTSFANFEGNNISIEDGLAIAEQFAVKAGIDNMFNVWYQSTGGVLYVNLAPIINHVIHYPDLIKVKVDLTSGNVVGWEASNYATNNKSRNFSSTITLLDAKNKLSSALTIIERNYAIVPDKFVGEVSAYEFICTWKNYTYYIYIDSNTGEEVNILRVIDTSNGSLLE